MLLNLERHWDGRAGAFSDPLEKWLMSWQEPHTTYPEWAVSGQARCLPFLYLKSAAPHLPLIEWSKSNCWDQETKDFVSSCCGLKTYYLIKNPEAILRLQCNKSQKPVLGFSTLVPTLTAFYTPHTWSMSKCWQGRELHVQKHAVQVAMLTLRSDRAPQKPYELVSHSHHLMGNYRACR